MAWLALLTKEKFNNVLMVTPSIELLEQNFNKLNLLGEGMFETLPTLFTGSVKKKEISKFTVATVQSLAGKGELFKDFDLIIVDEAHYKYPSKKNKDGESSVFNKFLEEVRPKKLLALTATPYALGNKRGFSVLEMLMHRPNNFFGDFVHITQNSEIISEGRWSDLVYQAVGNFSREDLVVENGEFSEKSVSVALQKYGVNNTCCIEAKKIINGSDKSKTLIFVNSVETAEKMAEYLRKYVKRRVEVVSAKTKIKERKEIINTFCNTHDVACIINYGTLTTGFDCPDLTNIIMARPTNSLSLYAQIIGRLVRIHESKEYGIFLDLCGNVSYFGGIEDLVLEYIENFGWACTAKDKVLTGVPLNQGSGFTKDYLKNLPLKAPRVESNLKIHFGKFQGKLVKSLSVNYRDYLINFYENVIDSVDGKNVDVYTLLLELRERDVINLLRSKN